MDRDYGWHSVRSECQTKCPWLKSLCVDQETEPKCLHSQLEGTLNIEDLNKLMNHMSSIMYKLQNAVLKAIYHQEIKDIEFSTASTRDLC